MTGKPVEIYKYLEPLYNDYRKIAYRGMNGWEVLHVDEFIDALLVKELVCDVALPHLPRRVQLEDAGLLQPRVSALEDLMSSSDEEEEEEAAPQAVEKKAPTRVSRFSEPIAPQG
jgi:pre-mRNA-splicing factor 38A